MTTQLTLVLELINSLTEDEDLRQELWIHYLSDRACSSLDDHLELLQIYQKVNCDNQHRLDTFISSPLSSKYESAVAVLEPVERHVVYLLVLGLSPDEIAKYKGIGEIRVQRVITSIQASPTWIQLFRDTDKCLRNRSKTTKSSD
jgi:hypothetical protein